MRTTARLLAVGLVTVWATFASAEDVSTKKLFVKDHADAAKRQIQVQSKDGGVQFAEADDPATNGAALHVYSATDDFCVLLPGGADWVGKPTKWKYKNKASGNSAQIQDGKVTVKIKSGVTYTLQDDGTQGTVNAQLQFGAGTRYCMRCTGNKKDEALKFLAKDCVAAPCDAEPSSCGGSEPSTTTTSTTVDTSTTTTTTPSGGVVLKGVLPAGTGLFNYTPAQPGVPGANTRCNVEFPGTHACVFSELQAAEAAGDLVGLKDLNNVTVASFWVIDSGHAGGAQCADDVGNPASHWQYQTAHTGVGGERVPLSNGTGALGAVASGLICFGQSWVGCCQ